jgi:hypothetical protein
VCSGLGGRRRHTLQDTLILQARVLALEGGSSTLSIDDTFSEVRPSFERRRGPRISAPKDDVTATPGQSLPGTSTGIRPEQAARPVTPGASARTARARATAAPPTTGPVALTPRRDRRRFWQERTATLRLRRNNRAKKGTPHRSISYPFPFFLFLYLLQQGPGKGDTPKRILPVILKFVYKGYNRSPPFCVSHLHHKKSIPEI